MWEQPPHVERHSASGHRGLPSCTRLHKKHSSWRDIRSDTRTRTLRAPALSIKRVFFTHLRMTEEREWGGFGGRCWQEISPALHPAGLPSRQTCCRCRPGWTLWSSYWEEKCHNSPSLAFLRTLSTIHPFSLRLRHVVNCDESRKSNVFDTFDTVDCFISKKPVTTDHRFHRSKSET